MCADGAVKATCKRTTAWARATVDRTEAAGWTIVASAERGGHRLFAVVLQSEDRDADASGLLDWAFASYRWLPLGAKLDGTLKLAIRLGLGRRVRSFTRELFLTGAASLGHAVKRFGKPL